MQTNNTIEKILKTEDAYIKNFSKSEDYTNFTRYTDEKLPGMYDYNYTLIDDIINPKEINEIIDKEIILRKQQNKDFFNVLLKAKPCLQNYIDLYKNVAIEHDGYYVYIPMKIPNWNTLKNCTIKKISDKTTMDDLLNINLTYDSNPDMHDFEIQKSKHQNDIYTDTSKPLNCYICYYNNIPVCRCELLIYNNVAKIEDFIVLDEYQRRGIGTTVMQYLIKESLNADCELIYLVADEEDTPKEMYMNMGFSKVDDIYGILMKL